MPMRQIRKHKSKSRSRKHFTSNSKLVQRGGDDGRYVLPPAYFGKGMNGYYADGSSALNSCSKQHAVSHGVISANGKMAGPNLYPMMGGNCGCSGRRNYKNPKPTQHGGMQPKKSLHPKKSLSNKKTKSHKY
jgi:hypothetical protein